LERISSEHRPAHLIFSIVPEFVLPERLTFMNARRALRVVVCLFAATCLGVAQQRVSPLNMYERVLAIVPLIGKGTAQDPIRPLYAPVPSFTSPPSRTGILGYTHVLSDDGKFALVEFVARDRSAFSAILADTTIKVWLKGRDNRADAIAAFQQHKANFDFSHFGVRLP
jgi:hypothetical protein